MPNYHYRARSSRGEAVEGDLEATSMEAVAAQLFNAGITPIEIVERSLTPGLGNGLLEQLTARKPGIEDLILLSRQLSALLRAGVPIHRAINGLARSLSNQQMVAALVKIQGNLESGRELSSALAYYPDIFPPIFIAMVRIGETTGRLGDALLQLSRYLETDKDTMSRIKSALQYPKLVVIALGVAIAVINIMVIPAFAKVFEKAKVQLPLPTRILMGTSDLFVHYWPLMLCVGVIGFIGTRIYLNSERGSYLYDKWKLQVPIIGSIIHRATLARLCRALAMSLAAGLPVTQALTISAKAAGNQRISEHVFSLRNAVERGESLSRAAVVTGLFTPLILQMLQTGEETGLVDDMLAEVASFYEQEVDYEVKNLATNIEPLLIAFIAVAVLVLALGVFLPMWDLATISRKS